MQSERDVALAKLAALERAYRAMKDTTAGLIIASTQNADDLRDIREYLGLLTPLPTNVAKKRVGKLGDGGYVIADHHVEPRRAISLGIGYDESFDRELLSVGYAIHQFDYMEKSCEPPNPSLTFTKARIVGRNPGPEETTLEAIVADLSGPAAGKPNIFLKCDIENYEWTMLDCAAAETLARLSQIVIEFHSLSGLLVPERRRIIRACVEKVLSRHIPIHVHGNNAANLVVTKSLAFPEVLEVTFLHRTYVGRATHPAMPIYPSALDYPNVPNRPELFLGPFAWRSD